MNIVIKGNLDRRSEKRSDASGNALLIFTVRSEGAGWPVEVRMPFGTDHLGASAYAERMPKGAHVAVEATELSVRTDHSTAAILARGVGRVDVRLDHECFVVPGVLR